MGTENIDLFNWYLWFVIKQLIYKINYQWVIQINADNTETTIKVALMWSEFNWGYHAYKNGLMSISDPRYWLSNPIISMPEKFAPVRQEWQLLLYTIHKQILMPVTMLHFKPTLLLIFKHFQIT